MRWSDVGVDAGVGAGVDAATPMQNVVFEIVVVTNPAKDGVDQCFCEHVDGVAK